MAYSPYRGTFRSFEDAVAFANTTIADSNAADFAGVPLRSYEIFEVAGIYGPYFEVAFIPEYVVIAGTRFDNPIAVAA